MAGSPVELELRPEEDDDEPSPLLEVADPASLLTLAVSSLAVSSLVVCVLAVAATEVEPPPVPEPPSGEQATAAQVMTSPTEEKRSVDTSHASYVETASNESRFLLDPWQGVRPAASVRR